MAKNNPTFEQMLASITSNENQTRKAICLAFRAAMNDLYNSKSAERLNQLTAVVSNMPYWGKIKKAVLVFAGGYDLNLGVDLARYYNPDKSCVRYDSKAKLWEVMPMDEDAWIVYRAAYADIASADYDAVPTKTRPGNGMDLSQIQNAAAKLASSRDKWNPRQRAQIEQVLSALSGVLPGFEIDIDANPKALAHTADISGNPA